MNTENLEKARALLAHVVATTATTEAAVTIPTASYSPTVLTMPEVEDELTIDELTQTEELNMIRRLDLVQVFNLTTHKTFTEWLKYPAIIEAAGRLADLMPHDSIRKDGVRCANVISTARKEQQIPLKQVAIYTCIWAICQERTSAQAAAMLPCYHAGTPEADRLTVAVDELLYTASQCRPSEKSPALVTLREAIQDTRGTRWILSNIHELTEEAKSLVTYSGLIFNPRAYVTDNNEIVFPAIYEGKGTKRRMIKRAFTCKCAAGSKLSPVYKMPELTPEIEAYILKKEEEHRIKAEEIERENPRDADGNPHIKSLIHEQMKPVEYAYTELKEYAGMEFKVLMNHDSRGRETAASASGQFMPTKIRAALNFADAPAGSRLYHRDGTALCLALSGFINGWLLPHEAEELNLTSVKADPYKATINRLGEGLQEAIQNFWIVSLQTAIESDTVTGGNSVDYWLEFESPAKYLREVVKKAVTPISYGSGQPTAIRAVVENTQLPELLSARVVTLVRGYKPLKEYLKRIQAGKNLNSAKSYEFTFEYDGKEYLLTCHLDNTYQGDVFQIGRVPVHYTFSRNDAKARQAAPANFNQHLEAVLLKGMRAIAEHKAEDSTKPQEWRIFATHDSIGTLNPDNTEYLTKAVPFIANAWAKQAQGKLFKHFGIDLLPRNTWLAEDGELYKAD